MIALLRALSGLIIWAVAFSMIYALQGLSCSPRLSTWVAILPYQGREVLISVWVAFLLLLGWLSWHLLWGPARQDWSHQSLPEWLAPSLALTGLVATAFTGFPVIFATMCA